MRYAEASMHVLVVHENQQSKGDKRVHARDSLSFSGLRYRDATFDSDKVKK